MTNTNTLAPTDAEILDAAEDFRSQYMHGGVTFYEFDGIGYTRAVLAKWGAPALASQPFAYEFSRSNGDGTHSEHIERGRLQEVAPGRWEHSGLPRGALADKPIKALYTTPQTQPAAVPASGPVGFDHKTAANFLNGKTVTDDEMRQFVAHSRWAHDDRDGLRNTIADLRREITRRDSEIALLKTSLLDAEALELRSAPAGMEPVAWLIERSAFTASPDGQDADGNEWLEEAQSPEEPGAFAVFTAAQVQAMLRAALAAPAQPAAHVSQETFNDDGTSDIIIPALPIGMALYAAPQPAAQALDAARVFWQQHTQADALSMTMAELHTDVELVIRAARGAAQDAPVDAAAQKDAARYRFLRDGDWRDTGLERYIVLQLGLMWDDKIDAAIADQQGGA